MSSPNPAANGQKSQWNTKHLGLRLASDFTAAFSAACAVAPIITIIDKAIIQNASGQAPLKASLKASARTLILRPHNLLFSKPFTLIALLYGGTYFTANTLDTATSTVQNRPATHTTHGTLKFAASSTANISLCLFKDQAFARLFGPGGPPRPVPLPSYALFTIRDCLTIFASFNVPPLLAPLLNQKMGDEVKKKISGQTAAQFLAPAVVQIVSTPLHLLGLDLYNRHEKVGWKDRWNQVKGNWAVSVAARMCRIIPAFGVGGVVNEKVRRTLLVRIDE